MQKNLSRICALLLLAVITNTANSQVTALSNNTNLESGGVVNGKAILISRSDSLWTSNGTAAGTVKLTSTVSIIDTLGFALFNNKLFFAGKNAAKGVELWATDGTAAGTVLIKDIRLNAASSLPRDFFVFNNKLYFSANDGVKGIELWTSDGTAAGTVLLKDIFVGATSGIDRPQFFANGTILYFVARDATNGKELWKTNGTAAGTLLVKNITAGTAGTTFTQFTRLGTATIFSINVLVGGFDQQMQLWKTDGTTVGTILLKNFGTFSGLFPPSFFTFNNKVYFVGTQFTTTGAELWTTNGTAAGTLIVKDIFPGTSSSTPFLFNAIKIGTKFFFAATDAKGTELWGSNGTAAGTLIVKDINPGAASSTPLILKNYTSPKGFGAADTSLFAGKIFLTATTAAQGTELWITNGTAAGTLLVKDIRVGKKNGIDTSFSYIYTTAGLYFSANDSLKGIEPWKSNGTAAGTLNVANINPALKSSSPLFMFIFNNQLFLNANNGDNTVGKRDLYKVTAATVPLPTMEPVPEPLEVVAPNSKLKFVMLPNPVTNDLNIQLSDIDSKNVSVRIVDNNGTIVMQRKLSGASNVNQRFNVSGLQKGIYYLQLVTDTETRIAKFVKE